MTHQSLNQAEFKDASGRVWELNPTLAFAGEFLRVFAAVRAEADEELLIFYISCLWVLCEEQARGYGVEPPEFCGIVDHGFVSALWISLEKFSSEFAAMSMAYRRVSDGRD